MEDWYNWDEFLTLIAAEHDLATAERKVFLTCFARHNLEQTDETVAQLIDMELEAYKKAKSRIYTKFAPSCPEIDHKGRGKSISLRAWLENRYQVRYQMPVINTIPVNSSSIPGKNISTSNLVNPFVPLNGVVDQAELFFNRQQELKRIFELLNSRSSISIIGEREIGKSSLLKAVYRQSQQRLENPRQPIYLNLQSLANEDDFYSALCEQVNIPESRGYRLARELKQHRLLLLLDEAEKMTWDGFSRQLQDQLRSLAEGSDAPLRLIFAARTSLQELFSDSSLDNATSPLAGICTEESLKPWDKQTASAFITHRLKPTRVEFAEEDREWLINQSGGYPKQLMQLCHQTYTRYLETTS